MAAIEVRNLTKRYGNRTAVDDITFTVEEGEIVGFLGPNGAGKSTTLRILTCFQPATSGSARVAGYDVFTESTRVRENTGYLPESTPLYTEMRVRSYLNYRATLKGVPGRDRRQFVNEAMARCQVRDVEDRIIGHLSKGYRQRVGLADALVHKPQVLVLDEPTSGLDPNQVRDVRDLVKEIAGDTTVLFSTHTIPWVEQVCERVLVIHQGRLIMDGTLSEMRARVDPLARIEFHTNLPAATALAMAEAVPSVLFAENLTMGESTFLRLLAQKEDAAAALDAVRAAVQSANGEITGQSTSPAIFEDLFATATRGAGEEVIVR